MIHFRLLYAPSTCNYDVQKIIKRVFVRRWWMSIQPIWVCCCICQYKESPPRCHTWVNMYSTVPGTHLEEENDGYDIIVFCTFRGHTTITWLYIVFVTDQIISNHILWNHPNIDPIYCHDILYNRAGITEKYQNLLMNVELQPYWSYLTGQREWSVWVLSLAISRLHHMGPSVRRWTMRCDFLFLWNKQIPG